METLVGTRLNMCLKPKQTAEMNTPHYMKLRKQSPRNCQLMQEVDGLGISLICKEISPCDMMNLQASTPVGHFSGKRLYLIHIWQHRCRQTDDGSMLGLDISESF